MTLNIRYIKDRPKVLDVPRAGAVEYNGGTMSPPLDYAEPERRHVPRCFRYWLLRGLYMIFFILVVFFLGWSLGYYLGSTPW